MKERRKYYKWSDSDYDLLFACKRAGLSFYWSLDKRAYILESKYLKSFSTEASSEEQTFENFACLIQKPTHWRKMANDLLHSSTEYRYCYDEAFNFDRPLKIPSQFWTFVIMRALFRAYEEPRNDDTISRIHAFIDWSMWHYFDEKDQSSEVWTANLFCFFENIPDCPAALSDFPNWYPYNEIAYMLEFEPMQRVKASFEQAYTSKT